MQPEQAFWEEMPAHVHDVLSELDETYEETISTATRLLMKCHDSGLHWPNDMYLNWCYLYMLWGDIEITIFRDSLYLNVFTGPECSIAHIVTHLFSKQYKNIL
jgi:hypothetical protein